MTETTADQGLEQLARIEHDLEEIRDRTPRRPRAFVYGVLYGAGAVVGGVVGIALLGWALSFFGVIPGLSDMAHYLQSIVDRAQH